MLMKLGRGIVRVAGLHPLATTTHVAMKEEVKPVTATSDGMLQRCEDLNAVYEEKDELNETAITLVRDRTTGYNSDSKVVTGNSKQKRHETKMNGLEQVERGHNAYCATLEYRNLVEYLDSITAGRYCLQGFC